MVRIRLSKLRRRNKYCIMMGIFIYICLYKMSRSLERQPQEYGAARLHLRSKENETINLHHSRLARNKLISVWTKHMTSSKWKKFSAGARVVNGTNIGPEILHFFELRSDEEKDEFVNLHKYAFKLDTDLCKMENAFLAVVIHSAPRYTQRRNRIRDTFRNVVEHRGRRIVYVFVIGDVLGSDDQKNLNIESKFNGDMVQGNFYDLYKHLARKHIMAMHWFKQNCNAKYVLKLDDDTFINPYNIVDFILDVEPTGKEMWCKFADYSQPERGKSKWHTSRKEYPFPVFPPFCQGFAYIATRESWLAIYEVSVSNRKISMDDVYVTGILAVKAGVQRYDFSHMLWRCYQKRAFIPTDIQKKAILYDPLNRCSHIPFEKWNKLKKIFVNKTQT